MNVSTFNFLERKLTGGSKILFNLGNKFFHTSMINGAINVFPRVCICLFFFGGGGGEGWRGLLKTFIDHEN